VPGAGCEGQVLIDRCETEVCLFVTYECAKLKAGGVALRIVVTTKLERLASNENQAYTGTVAAGGTIIRAEILGAGK
jgi:hypothetical protein